MLVKKLSTALSHIHWVLYLSREYLSIKGTLETTSLHTIWVLYQSGTESNTKRQASTALLHVS